ncbi:uncharacterized protein LOC130434930 isoform X1 [Triplophysa dalaica]|uniref:uncharacterized protein LOC130434930 isoform X1 n=1 Tax=Triplophysa dalaica TaxID=1582913 RepID=UPI0024E001A4|nr:uncharacterized protein LOC130434930 isoform X1 [Triplophysa dalaica]
MDHFVQEKLKEWNLEVLIPCFKDEQIDRETLLLLDEKSLEAMIPKIGLRLKFKKHLRELLVEPQPEQTQSGSTSGPPVNQQPEAENQTSVEEVPSFNISEVLMSSVEGKDILASLKKNTLSLHQRRCMVRILVSNLMSHFGENPSSEKKMRLAVSLVEQYPCLKDSQGKGHEAWFSPGRSHRPATGFLEERLRNVRKRSRRETNTSREKNDSEAMSSISRNLFIPEPSTSPDRAVQLAEWLKNNMWPANQVAEYMKETAIHRAHWIRANGTKSIEDITVEFPRLLDTPGMISQDFAILFPNHAERLSQTWKFSFKDKILRFASQEKKAQELLHNIDSLSPVCTDAQSDLALRLLPVILPTPVYKNGMKMFKPSLEENIKAFIEFKHVGTNMVEYLKKAELTKPFPFVLGLGDDSQCHQAFVVVGKQALEQNTLLSAVDTCFKLFYVMDIHFPKQCSPVWEFFQTAVYKLPGTESPSVRLLRGFLSF